MQFDGLEELAAATVKQAIEDYVDCLNYFNGKRELRKSETEKSVLKMKKECERFFLNDGYFSIFSNMDGEKIMKLAQKRAM